MSIGQITGPFVPPITNAAGMPNVAVTSFVQSAKLGSLPNAQNFAKELATESTNENAKELVEKEAAEQVAGLVPTSFALYVFDEKKKNQQEQEQDEKEEQDENQKENQDEKENEKQNENHKENLFQNSSQNLLENKEEDLSDSSQTSFAKTLHENEKENPYIHVVENEETEQNDQNHILDKEENSLPKKPLHGNLLNLEV